MRDVSEGTIGRLLRCSQQNVRRGEATVLHRLLGTAGIGFNVNLSRVFRSTTHRGGAAEGFAGATTGGGLC